MKVSRLTKFIVLLNCGVPAVLLGWDAGRGQLGANPVNFAIRTTGLLSLIFLVASLMVTPVMRLSGWNWLVPFRRMLGLYAFFHTAAHFLIFFGFDRSASVKSTAAEIWMRPFLLVGTLSLVLMTPLAVTSTNGMIRRLGPKRWKLLHRLAYVCATLGVVHYYMLVKSDVTQPLVFAGVLGALLGFRVVAHYWQLRTGYNKLRAAPAPMPAMQPAAGGPGPAARARFWSGQLRVARVFDETPDVRTFRLVPATGTRLPFEHLPGQYLNLSLTIDGARVNRSYTIASSPTRGGYCELTVKREARGTASRHLHDTVREGQLLNVSAPAGRFTFTGTESEGVVMIAGGVGVTPLMAKVRYLTDLSWPGHIYLLLSAKTERDLIFREEIEYLRRRHPNLHVTATLTRADGIDWAGERGRFSTELLTRVVPGIASQRVHFCGPAEMTEPMTRMLRDLGVSEDRIKMESFTSPSRADAADDFAVQPSPAAAEAGMASAEAGAAATASAPAGMATITFARSAKVGRPAPGKTVLEAAEDLGVNIDFDCRSGICGQCKTKLIAGSVKMDSDEALTAVDRANDFILCCQARAVGNVTVDA